MLNKNNILGRPVFIFLRTLHQFLVPEKGIMSCCFDENCIYCKKNNILGSN